ncbi:hypothetical protein OH492_15800 [Vibrio chagasii]|nr:hypothetical protein [Vibrio chagasii]
MPEQFYPNYKYSNKEHNRKKPNGWHFIDGEIFDDKKGYIIETTPAEGKVTKIIRSLNL